MTLRLTPNILAGAYEYLRACPPFKRWKLPPADEIELIVNRSKQWEGEYTRYCRTTDHIIGVSDNRIGHTTSLMQVMGHEIIHLKQGMTKTETKGVMHNAEFRQLAVIACRYHGWDARLFV